MRTQPPKLDDLDKVQTIIDQYFQDREQHQEVRELKNGDKRIYREPPSVFRLCERLGVTTQTFYSYLDPDYLERHPNIKKEMSDILSHAKERIVNELTEGVLLGYWNDRVAAAMLAKYGVIGNEDQNNTVTIHIQGCDSWSE